MRSNSHAPLLSLRPSSVAPVGSCAPAGDVMPSWVAVLSSASQLPPPSGGRSRLPSGWGFAPSEPRPHSVAQLPSAQEGGKIVTPLCNEPSLTSITAPPATRSRSPGPAPKPMLCVAGLIIRRLARRRCWARSAAGCDHTAGTGVDCTCTMMRWPGAKTWFTLRQPEFVIHRLARRQRRRRVEAMDIAAAVDLDADGQLHPRRLGLVGAFIGIDIDQLDHPVAVACRWWRQTDRPAVARRYGSALSAVR